LKARYHSFESRRELLSEHDVFLADDRIITRLPDTLGKVFYKGTIKRPIPIQIAQENRIEGKRVNPPKQRVPNKEKHASVASPTIVAKEVEKALKSVPVSLKPGTGLSVRVGNTKLTPQQLADNISVVARGIIERHVVKGWRNVKSIHVKSPNSAAIPIWLSDDMWAEDEGVADGLEVDEHELALIKKSRRGKRRSESGGRGSVGRRGKAPADPANGEDRLLAAARRAKLSQQKARAMQEDVLVSSSS
jgi:ribosome biogenesis protein UTP30